MRNKITKNLLITETFYTDPEKLIMFVQNKRKKTFY